MRAPIILVGIALLAAGAFTWSIWDQPPRKCGALAPLIREIDEHVRAGNSPPLSSLAAFRPLSAEYSIYTGERNGATWQPFSVNGHDFTVLITTSGYQIFVPVEEMKLTSWTSFETWRYASDTRKWQKGRIHWTWGGSFWSAD